MGALLSEIANFNPTGFALKNQGLAATNQQTQANTADIQAQTQQRQQKATLEQQQIKDAEAIRDAYAGLGTNAAGMNPGQITDTLNKQLVGKLSGPGFLSFQQKQLELQKMALAVKQQD